MRYGSRKIMSLLVAIASVGMVALACARVEPENLDLLEKQAFNAWIEKHVKGKGIEVVEQSNGMWVEFLDEGDQGRDQLSGRDTVWFKLNYTATDTHGNVFVTRDSIEAMRQRTYTPYTNYEPDFLLAGPQNIGIIEGQHFALTGDLQKSDGSTMRMTKGSRVRLYMPSYLAYGTTGFSDSQGYGGQFPLDGSKIVVEDISVVDVIKDPIDHEEELVTKRAITDWKLSETDTLSAFLYVDSVKFKQRPDIEAQFPNKVYSRSDSLGVDSLAKIRFIGRFLNGFIFDTNIQSVYDEFYNRRESEGYPADDKTFTYLSFTASTDLNKYIPAFSLAIPKLRRGLWYRLVFTSAYGYGATGLSARIRQQRAEYKQYMEFVYANMYYRNMYSSGYYDNYNTGYYDPYFNQSMSALSQTETKQEIITEIQPYTPLIFEIYIEPVD